MAAWFSFTGTSHHSLLPDILLGHLLAVSCRPYPGMAPQSLPYSFQPLCLLRDPHTFLGCIWLWQGLSVILTPFRLPQINFFTLSFKCFSSEPNSCPDIGIGPLLQFPHLLRTGPVPLALLFPPTLPLFYRVLCGSIYSFPSARDSSPFSAGDPQARLCLKVYFWGICGETCTPCPPTPPPSCSSSRRLSFSPFYSLELSIQVGLFFYFSLAFCISSFLSYL